MVVRDTQLRSMPPPIDISGAHALDKGRVIPSLVSLSFPHVSRGLDQPNITFHRQTRRHLLAITVGIGIGIQPMRSSILQSVQWRCRNGRNDSTNGKESARETEN